ERVRSEVADGHQAYVVCPLVEESERIQARSATEEFKRLQGEELEGLRVGLLHGQMPPAKKEEAMDLFRRRAIDVRVATTAIEVRGEGPSLGTGRKCRTELKLASLRREKDVVARARAVACDIVDGDPLLAHHADLNDEVGWLVDPEEAEFLFKS